MLQWHDQAVEPRGDARSDLWFTYHLGRRIRAKLAASADEADRPLLDLTWDYPVQGPLDDPDADAVLAEINGWDAERRPLSAYTQLTDDGSTVCGCWIYCGVHADGVNQAARRKPGQQQSWVAPEWGWAWPANRRVLYNRASADPDGKPWSERKALVWWDEEQGRWAGHDVPDFVVDRPPSYRPPDGATGPAAISGVDPFIMQADGKAWLFAPAGLVDGPLPTHYEPQESPFPNLVYGQQHNPVRQLIRHPENRYQPSGDQPGAEVFPYVTTTYRLTEHHTAGGMSRFLPYLAELQPAFFCEVSPAARRRARPGAPRLGDDHHRSNGDRGPGAGHRTDPTPAGAGSNAAPGGASLALGTERVHHRGRRQRARPPGARPERAHPGGQGDGLRHPPGPAAAGAGAA